MHAKKKLCTDDKCLLLFVRLFQFDDFFPTNISFYGYTEGITAND